MQKTSNNVHLQTLIGVWVTLYIVIECASKHRHMQTDMGDNEYINIYNIHDTGAGGCTFEH